MAAVDIVWHRIVDYSVEVFHQKHGKSFVYSVSRDTVYLDTIDRDLSRHHIAEALARMPLTGPGEIADLGGASYIYTIPTAWRITGRRPPTSAHIAAPRCGMLAVCNGLPHCVAGRSAV